MDTHFLVATQLSSLFPGQATSYSIQTTRQGVPLPAASGETDTPAEHATYSTTLHTQATGTLLLRVLHGGLIVEVVSLSTEVPPLRLILPGTIVSSPALFLWESSELHVLAVASTGSLFRVVIPIGTGRDLWRTQGANIWHREHLFKDVDVMQDGLVHVQGIHSVLMGLRNGSLLRLENEYGSEECHETVFQQSSFLSSLTSFLPLSGGNPEGFGIISIATHPWPTDIGHAWTLSRDRTLRFWKAKIGCVASKALPAGKESGSSPGGSTYGGRPSLLLDAQPQTLLRVFTTPVREEHVYVIAFIPTISSPSSGGTFHVLDTVTDQIYEVGKIEASLNTAHCHLQDFIVAGNTIVALWDHQGQSIVERSAMNVERFQDGFRADSWSASCYAPEPELTPAYLEEHLLSPGSMTEKFFEAIMRPGIFSPLTLRTAIDQYTDVCLSMPGPSPPQLTAAYATTSEQIAAVVGCTVILHRDPHTGAFQHANYWSALKRDWEGFIARCREIERSARRPLALGIQDQIGLILVERERVGLVVKEDPAIYLRKVLAQPSSQFDPQYELLNVLWYLQSTLGPQVLLDLEGRMMDIIRQEISFTIPEIMKDQTDRFNFREEMEPDVVQWISGKLYSFENLDLATRTALDVIGGFDVEIKQEEDEVELLLPPPRSAWSQALITSYISKTVEARYDIALILVTMLFFLSEDLSDWDPTLLSEIFAVYRGTAMLRYASRQPALPVSNAPAPSSDPTTADDVISRMRNMNVSRSHRSLLFPNYSLIHRLISQAGGTDALPGAAHRYLDATGLLQSVAPGNATQYEVVFCETLRLLGFYDPSRELLSWLPRTPGASYVQARLWLNMGRVDDAAHLFEKLSGSFASNHGGHSLSPEDQEILAKILPATELLDSQHFFYIHVSNLFKMASWTQYEVSFAQLAISVAPFGVDTSSLWSTVIHGFTELALYEDAYASIMSTPYENLQRDFASQLAFRMCDEKAVDKLMAFNFAGLGDEVAEALAFKARNMDSRAQPSYSRILYTWFIRRGDYRNAALAMYQRARRLQDIITDTTSFTSLAEEQLEAYGLAINSLSLVDLKNAWVLLPLPADNAHEPRKRRKFARHIPENKFTPGKSDSDLVRLADIEYDYALLAAQIDIIRRDPTILSSPEDTSDWLLTDNLSSWSGTPVERGWRYLRQSLQQHDNPDTDHKYSKATLETILAAGRTFSPPPWLINVLEVGGNRLRWTGNIADDPYIYRNITMSTSFESVYDTKTWKRPLNFACH
ncbi:hypothetical protein H0H87_004253 [Tephrocybe sp. NHM501043]|nr:hypothetical protein H0H87_004253 [Tephrocybe sp. NHM501043]